ncbi:MAG: tripartite tricarboxylate transporter substrate binding protein [Alcaligenaceae bacterium]
MKFITTMVVSLGLGVSFGCAAQDPWPTQKITFVVPYPAGGPTDTMARLLSVPMASRLGTPVVVDNRSGASGNIGTGAVARAKPDGYTILLATSGNMSVNQSLFKNLNYDPIKDFAPIIQISTFPLVLEVKADSPIKTMSDYLALARAEPMRVTFGSAGNGTPMHLCPELIKKIAGVSLQHVPYKGTNPALTDLLGGQITSACDVIVGSIKYIQNGQFRAIAVTTKERVAVLPDVPTMDESGLKGFDYFAWHGIAAPTGTPASILTRYNTVFNEIFNDPEFAKKWEASGSPVVGGSAQKFSTLILSEAERLGALVKELGIQAD